MLHSVPMPGDVVRLDGDYVGARQGAYAVLGGRLDRTRDEFEVCFSASAFRDEQFVSCSGGPVPFVGAEELVATGETRPQTFWRWRDNIAGAGRGEAYTLEVPVWSWTPGSYRARADRALATYRFWAEDDALWLPDAQRAARILGFPVVERPMPDVRKFLDPSVPAAIGEFAVWLCNRARIGGSSDVMYLCNIVAFESGRGDGQGNFYTVHRESTQADVDRIVSRLIFAYSSCIRSKNVLESEITWRLAGALSLIRAAA